MDTAHLEFLKRFISICLTSECVTSYVAFCQAATPFDLTAHSLAAGYSTRRAKLTIAVGLTSASSIQFRGFVVRHSKDPYIISCKSR